MTESGPSFWPVAITSRGGWWSFIDYAVNGDGNTERAEDMRITTDNLATWRMSAYDNNPSPFRELELDRFLHIIRNEDPAASAWNPVTGMEAVLCRVCGRSADPRKGEVLTHRPEAPCAPLTELTGDYGHTTQVRHVVLLKSANMKEEPLGDRGDLQPWEELEIAVRAYRRAWEAGTPLLSGPVWECRCCLEISRVPMGTPEHRSRCAGSDGSTFATVDPATVRVAAVHLPGSRSLTDPDWYHLEAGWWVAPFGTKGPPWAEAYVASASLSEVGTWANTPDDLTPVRLSASDRSEARKMEVLLNRLAGYFGALDRPETLHGITDLTQAISTAIRQSWRALESLHDEDSGSLFHAALGCDQTCPVCEHLHPSRSLATERRTERLAEVIHARMVGESGRPIPVRVVWAILEQLTRLRAEGDTAAGSEHFEDVYSLACQATDLANTHLLPNPDPRGQGHFQVSLADSARVLRHYRRYLQDGGTL